MPYAVANCINNRWRARTLLRSLEKKSTSANDNFAFNRLIQRDRDNIGTMIIIEDFSIIRATPMLDAITHTWLRRKASMKMLAVSGSHRGKTNLHSVQLPTDGVVFDEIHRAIHLRTFTDFLPEFPD